MYFSGPPQSGKTQRLVEIYIKAVQSGMPVDSMLVICANAYRKQSFLQKIKAELEGGYPLFNVYTINGIVYNTIKDYWPLLEKYLKGDPTIIPHLTGLETCEFLIKECIKQQNSKDKELLTFETFYGDRSLISQLIRRYRLMSENMLSFDDLLKRSQDIQQEHALPANECLKLLKIKTSQLRVLDFATQMSAFNLLLSKEAKIKEHFSKYKFLMVDDYDESIISTQNFVKFLLPAVEKLYIAYDEKGGTRRGYLGAYSDGWKEIVKERPNKVTKLDSFSPLKDTAEIFFNSIKERVPKSLSNFKIQTSANPVELFEDLKKVLDKLTTAKKLTFNDVVIVTPSLDSATKNTIEDYCRKNNIPWQFLTGSSKPIDNCRVYGALVIAQLINIQWNLAPSPFDIRMMLIGVLNFPPVVAERIAQEYEKLYKKDKKNFVLPNILLTELKEDYINAYENLLILIENLKEAELSLHEQMIHIFSKVLVNSLDEDETVEDYNRVIHSLYDFMTLIKVYKKDSNLIEEEKNWILQVKNEHIAENPVSPTNVLPDTLIIATPQKIVDIELTSKYQIWIDVSSSMWTKTQTAQLYNAWAYSKYYDGTLYDDDRFTKSIAAHMLRGLIYLCEEKIIALASTFDSKGYEQKGWLIQYLDKSLSEISQVEKPKLRSDQQPIIEYQKGTMAVAAVPGSGKTYVNVALIVKLIESGINPENILILTYMDSASQTLIRRIKSIFPHLRTLPHISTIHGLAYHIIRDEDNLSKLGLPDDLDIADDIIKPSIISAIANQTVPDGLRFEEWEKHIKLMIPLTKSYNLTPKDIEKYLETSSSNDLREFYPAYHLYFKELEHRGLIDFDDQIYYAIKLLEKFPETKLKYQEKFNYIIEDEAQDSTKLQQRLLALLTSKDNNYVRTGDVNQAIMTTFTPVDVDGFKTFINNAQTQVKMEQSQRCAKPIYTMANDLIEWSKEIDELKDAFLDIEMKAAGNANPNVEEPVFIDIFSSSDAEKTFVAKKLREIKPLIQNSTVAILVRSNNESIEWTRFLDSLGFSCICLTDNIQQKKVFKLIHSYLKVLHKPYNNKHIKSLYDVLVEYEFLKADAISSDFINSLGSPFISFSVSELPSSKLVQFYMDIFYWLDYSSLPPSELILKLSHELFDDAIDKSNGYIISIMSEKYRQEENKNRYKENFDKETSTTSAVGLPEIVQKFNALVKMRMVKGFKFFEKAENDDSRIGFIQVMTVHKAKGMGFDAVFVPHVWENSFSYPTRLENIHINSLSKLELELMNISGDSMDSEEYEYKTRKKQLEETLRLLYVAITRAKKYLYITSSKENSNRRRQEMPSRVLEYFMEKYQYVKKS